MELLISAGQVLPGPAGRRVLDGAVLVRDSAIVAVGDRAEVGRLAGADAERRDFPDATLLPGLIDCHVHLAFDASPDPVAAVQGHDEATLFEEMAARARRLLDTGVTTVRDLGDRDGLAVRLRESIAEGRLPGPRVLAATAPLTVPDGHCWFFGGVVDGKDAIRTMVRRNAAAGADVIKVMATGGGLTKGGAAIWESQFSAEELRCVVAEAHDVGLPVASHAHGSEGIAASVAAGVDTIEHCTWMAEGGFDVREDVVAEIAARGIHVCPGASPNWRGFAERFGQERAMEIFGRVRWMAEQGVRLIAGTDAGVPRAVFDNLTGSLEFFDFLGFELDRILELATVDAATGIGLGDSTGRLAEGYRADLLVVEGDPLTELDALREPVLVLAAGRPHVPGS
ncbi:amidohydrolase family protein [Amycolatopsis cihanbeyliensis]|uniref:Imidazolonepropionase-like amidohydrolase n=1 Tax=Amycolatopsis cihanbeyliensis TaxID=1128664 RepID=A0A542DC05_AMYCI|nr:amidohydrolase family protein [Amycolatopsis cihanbeyliensis]TQJ00604.1 imidazolonepropionase-like amidohydrolase [Amycolatopsis cihanbeyliensis]